MNKLEIQTNTIIIGRSENATMKIITTVLGLVIYFKTELFAPIESN